MADMVWMETATKEELKAIIRFADKEADRIALVAFVADAWTIAQELSIRLNSGNIKEK